MLAVLVLLGWVLASWVAAFTYYGGTQNFLKLLNCIKYFLAAFFVSPVGWITIIVVVRFNHYWWKFF